MRTRLPSPIAAGLDLRSALEFTLLGMIWGGSFLLMRIASPEIGAMPLAFLRVACGALILFPFLWMARGVVGRYWWQLGLIGMINSAVPFALFAWAAVRAPAGISAIANSTAVMLTAMVAFVMFGERIGLRQGVGLLAGFAGVVVLAGGNAAGLGVTAAAIAGVLASLCYAIAANLIRVHLVGLPSTAVAAATLLGASALLLVPAVLSWPQAGVSAQAWLCAALLGFVCTGIAYAFLFRLIGKVGVSRAVTVTYLVPLFGVAWAWLVIDEPLTWPMAVAGALILGGVALSQQAGPRNPVPAATLPEGAAALDAAGEEAEAMTSGRPPAT